ncbi:hypothetical protein BaRGS_00026457, partial [Batillaria attramentaria]
LESSSCPSVMPEGITTDSFRWLSHHDLLEADFSLPTRPVGSRRWSFTAVDRTRGPVLAYTLDVSVQTFHTGGKPQCLEDNPSFHLCQ